MTRPAVTMFRWRIPTRAWVVRDDGLGAGEPGIVVVVNVGSRCHGREDLPLGLDAAEYPVRGEVPTWLRSACCRGLLSLQPRKVGPIRHQHL